LIHYGLRLYLKIAKKYFIQKNLTKHTCFYIRKVY
jgi:hypothetical protein